MTDQPHTAKAYAKRHEQQREALERAARDVADAEARLRSARGAQRAVLVTNVSELGWPVSLAASATSISRETAHKWLRRPAAGGDVAGQPS